MRKEKSTYQATESFSLDPCRTVYKSLYRCWSWTKTEDVSRWLVIITFVLGLGFLLFAGILREARLIFPASVLVVSVYILNYRGSLEDMVII